MPFLSISCSAPRIVSISLLAYGNTFLDNEKGQWKWLSPESLCDPMDYTICGLLQARTMEWVAITSSRGSSQPRNRTQVSHMTGRFFTRWATREAQEYWSRQPIPSPADLLDPGIKPGSPALQEDLLPVEPSQKPFWILNEFQILFSNLIL